MRWKLYKRQFHSYISYLGKCKNTLGSTRQGLTVFISTIKIEEWHLVSDLIQWYIGQVVYDFKFYIIGFDAVNIIYIDMNNTRRA